MAQGGSQVRSGRKFTPEATGEEMWQPETVKYFGRDSNTGGSAAMTGFLPVPTQFWM